MVRSAATVDVVTSRPSEGVDAADDQDVVHQRDQHRHGELPLEAQRDVDRDDDQRGDDRDRSPSWPPSRRSSGRSTRRSGCRRARTRRSSASLTPSTSSGPAPRRDLDDVLAELRVVDRLDLRVAEARAARARRAPGRPSPPRSSGAVIRVPPSKSMPKLMPLPDDRQRARRAGSRRTSRRTTSRLPMKSKRNLACCSPAPSAALRADQARAAQRVQDRLRREHRGEQRER